jgi:hypothetical protein
MINYKVKLETEAGVFYKEVEVESDYPPRAILVRNDGDATVLRTFLKSGEEPGFPYVKEARAVYRELESLVVDL